MRYLKFLLWGRPYYELKSGMVKKPYFSLRVSILLQDKANWFYSRLYDKSGSARWNRYSEWRK